MVIDRKRVLILLQSISDKAIILNEGKIVMEGDINELTTSEDPLLKNFFSDEIFENNGSIT